MQQRREVKADEKMKRVQEMGQKAKDVADRRRRNRKKGDLKAALKEEYDSRQVWSREICKEVAEKFGLSVSQVYKWGWDYRKKLAEQQEANGY